MTNTMQVDLGGGRTRAVPVNYPANSGKAKSEKRVEKVTVGEVTQRKKPVWHRLAGSMTAGEDTESVSQYVLFDVLVPAAKNMISDAVSEGIQRLLFGDSRPRSGNRTGTGGYTSYNRYSSPARQETRELGRRSRATHDFDDLVLSTRVEAEEVLDSLRNLVDQYGTASVADLYDLVGVSGEFTDDKWGWTDLRNAGVKMIRGGYLVILPKTQPLE